MEGTGRIAGHVPLDTGMDEVDVVKAITGTTELDLLIPEVWAEEIEYAAQEKRVMRQLDGQALVVNTDLLDGPGDIVHIAKLNNLTAAAAIAETTEVDPQQMSDDELQLTPTEYATGVELTRKAMRRTLANAMDAAIKQLGWAMAQGEDEAIIAAAIAGASAEVYPDVSYTTVNNITADDVYTPDIIRRAKVTLESNNITGQMWNIIHPVQKGALLADDQFIVASEYGGNTVVMTGEIGEYLGVRILQTTNIPSAVNTGTVTYYKALFLGERALAIALKANPDYQEDYNVKARTTTIISVMEFEADVLNDERCLVCYSA